MYLHILIIGEALFNSEQGEVNEGGEGKGSTSNNRELNKAYSGITNTSLLCIYSMCNLLVH